MKKTTVDECLSATLRYRLVPFYIALLISIIAIASCIPFIINKSIAIASGCSIFAIVSLCLMIASLGYLAPYIYYKHKIEETRVNVVEDSCAVKEKCGYPGSGKSSSAMLEMSIFQPILEYQLRYDYWYYTNRLEYFKLNNMTDELKEYKFIKESFDYWNNQPNNVAWCCASATPCMMADGRKVMQYTTEHLMQEKYLPMYCIINLDEAGKLIPPQSFENKIKKIVDTFRFSRHYNFHFIFSEQRKDNVLIDVRGITEVVQNMEGRKTVCKPILLENHINRLKQKALKPNNENNNKLANKIAKLQDKENKIGFQIWYSSCCYSGTNGFSNQCWKRYYYYTRKCDFIYNSKGMMPTYSANYNTVDYNNYWEHLLINELEAKRFMASDKINAKTIEPLKLDKELKKIMPEIVIDCEVPTDNIDIIKLCEAIQSSDFIKNKWKKLSILLKNYDNIIAGNYKNRTSEELEVFKKQLKLKSKTAS